MNLIMRLSKRQDLRDHAADILTKTAKFSIQLKKSKENNEQETNKFMEGLKKKLNDFKNMRRLKLNMFIKIYKRI